MELHGKIVYKKKKEYPETSEKILNFSHNMKNSNLKLHWDSFSHLSICLRSKSLTPYSVGELGENRSAHTLRVGLQVGTTLVLGWYVCHYEVPDTRWLIRTEIYLNLFSHSSGGYKSEIKVLEGLAPSETSLLGL